PRAPAPRRLSGRSARVGEEERQDRGADAAGRKAARFEKLARELAINPDGHVARRSLRGRRLHCAKTCVVLLSGFFMHDGLNRPAEKRHLSGVLSCVMRLFSPSLRRLRLSFVWVRRSPTTGP